MYVNSPFIQILDIYRLTGNIGGCITRGKVYEKQHKTGLTFYTMKMIKPNSISICPRRIRTQISTRIVSIVIATIVSTTITIIFKFPAIFHLEKFLILPSIMFIGLVDVIVFSLLVLVLTAFVVVWTIVFIFSFLANCNIDLTAYIYGKRGIGYSKR
jgi:hypothetical protein